MKRTMCVILVCVCLGALGRAAAEEPAPTVILGAFGPEIELLEAALKDKRESRILDLRFVQGRLGNRPVVLNLTGVGKVNAAVSAALALHEFRPREVIFTGIAGGLNPGLQPGDIVVGKLTAQHDLGTLDKDGFKREGQKNPANGRDNPVFFPADPRLLKAAEAAGREVKLDKVARKTGAAVPKVVTGTIVTGDTFVSLPEKAQELRRALQADATEMEGAAAAQVCFQHGVPCLVVRSLSDMADEEAQKDLETFYKIAAHNSAAVVLALLAQLERN
jgi:adenosylhomocysteine nucleosidase